MKRAITILLALVMVLSLAACGGGSTVTSTPEATEEQATPALTATETPSTSESAPIPEPEPEPEPDPVVASIDLTVDGGNVKYNHFEKADSKLTDEENVYIFCFEFTNYQNKPSQFHSVFSIKFFQNGSEADSLNSWNAFGEQDKMIVACFNDVLKDNSITFGWPIKLIDDSPVTIMVEAAGSNDDTYQMMEVNLNGDNQQQGQEDTSPVEYTPIQFGTPFGTDFVEMTFTEHNFVEDARQSIKKGNVTRTFGPEPVEGKQFILLRGTIKNLGKENLPVYDFFLGEFDLNGFKYEIDTNDSFVYDSNGQHATNVEPLSTYDFIMWSAVPNELVKQKPAGTLTFGFYDLFDNKDMSVHKAFDDNPISFCPYKYQLFLQ